nr:unnamed protein product [Spirometra erinaceieuropaei]
MTPSTRTKTSIGEHTPHPRLLPSPATVPIITATTPATTMTKTKTSTTNGSTPNFAAATILTATSTVPHYQQCRPNPSQSSFRPHLHNPHRPGRSPVHQSHWC